MKEAFLDTVKRLFLKGGAVLRKCTAKSSIVNFIESLHPIKTQFDLIRFGPDGDGGYLIPDDLEGIEACFSPGVERISEFELDCLKRGMKVFLADNSVEKPNLDLPENQYNFIKKHVGYTNNDDYITMDHWVKTSNISDNSDLLLQMDIEGSELYSFINMSDALISRFRIMVVEFHLLTDLWNPGFFKLNQAVFDKILQTHDCIHIHANNCSIIDALRGIEIPRVAEFTFIRKDRVVRHGHVTELPHSLDFDNCPKRKSIQLPKNWYKSG